MTENRYALLVFIYYLFLFIYFFGVLSLDCLFLQKSFFLFLFLFIYLSYFILLYNTVLVLPYIDMNPPWVYMWSQTWTPLPLPSPQHPSGSSPCTSPKHAVSCIGHRLALRFLYTMEYYSAVKKNTFESVLMRWMKLEPIIQSEVSQKEKHQYSILTHIYGI